MAAAFGLRLPSQQAHSRVLAKAGSKRVEGRKLATGVADPSQELQEYRLST
jgi:hypothetical protein